MRPVGGGRPGRQGRRVRSLGTFSVPGTAAGVSLVLPAPLSFWGGVDPRTGVIIDASQPSHGTSLRGRILAMPSGRGSSSSASVLAELIRTGLGPVGIVMARADPIVTAGAMTASALYGIACPVVVAAGLCMPDDTEISIAPDPEGRAVVTW
jgi:predicted aconitase with swiveling domain